LVWRINLGATEKGSYRLRGGGERCNGGASFGGFNRAGVGGNHVYGKEEKSMGIQWEVRGQGLPFFKAEPFQVGIQSGEVREEEIQNIPKFWGLKGASGGRGGDSMPGKKCNWKTIGMQYQRGGGDQGLFSGETVGGLEKPDSPGQKREKRGW